MMVITLKTAHLGKEYDLKHRLRLFVQEIFQTGFEIQFASQ